MKRSRFWPPRFSVRTLAIVVTFVCMYFAAWETTKRHARLLDEYWRPEHYKIFTEGGEVLPDNWFATPAGKAYMSDFTDEKRHDPLYCLMDVYCPAPFIITERKQVVVSRHFNIKDRIEYYVWLFGAMYKLPFESECN